MISTNRLNDETACQVSDGKASDRLLDEYAAAAILALSVKTLRRWRWAGTGPTFIRLGRAVRYHRRDLDAFINAGRRRSTAEANA